MWLTNPRMWLFFFESAWLIVLNATFNNISTISWRSVLLVEETAVPGDWQTVSTNVVSSTPRHLRSSSSQLFSVSCMTFVCEILTQYIKTLLWINRFEEHIIKLWKTNILRFFFLQSIYHWTIDIYMHSFGFWLTVFNTTFNNISVISWGSVLSV
jgi:hypothetical protein